MRRSQAHCPQPQHHTHAGWSPCHWQHCCCQPVEKLRHREMTASPQDLPTLAGFEQDIGLGDGSVPLPRPSQRDTGLGPVPGTSTEPSGLGNTTATCTNPACSDLTETQQTHCVPAAALSLAAGMPPPPTSPQQHRDGGDLGGGCERRGLARPGRGLGAAGCLLGDVGEVVPPSVVVVVDLVSGETAKRGMPGGGGGASICVGR